MMTILNDKSNGFVKWSCVDEDGEFQYVGEITKVDLTENFIEFVDSKDSLHHVPLDDGKFELTEKPKNWKVNTGYFVTTNKEKPKVKRTKKSTGPSKKEAARAIFEETKHEGRSSVISCFMNSLEMSKAGASTYYYNFNKGIW